MLNKEKKKCKFCLRIRIFLLSAVCIIILIGTTDGIKLPNNLSVHHVGYIFLIIFILKLTHKIYVDYYKNSNSILKGKK